MKPLLPGVQGGVWLIGAWGNSHSRDLGDGACWVCGDLGAHVQAGSVSLGIFPHVLDPGQC